MSMHGESVLNRLKMNILPPCPLWLICLYKLFLVDIRGGFAIVAGQGATGGGEQPEKEKADGVASQPGDVAIAADLHDELRVEGDKKQDGGHAGGQK